MLLLSAQLGAIVHDFSHVAELKSAGFEANPLVADAGCSLCPAYAQASAPAFSHPFQMPVLGRSATFRSVQRQNSILDAAAPRARSRGPPQLL